MQRVPSCLLPERILTTYSAINSWVANGRKNGWKSTLGDLTDVEVIKKFVVGDIAATQGAVNIPVCSVADVVKTFQDASQSDATNQNYPCPP